MGMSDRKWETSPHRPEWEDLAWRVQEDAERILVARANWLHEKTGAKNLCLAGGVALNCVANMKIVAETPFENVWIQPAAGDDGIAIGCAYYGHHALKERTRRTFVMRDAFLGREYDRFDIEEAVRPAIVRLTTSRKRGPDVIRDAARLLAAGKVIGWLQGRSEFGPRALGNRSILADPRRAAMKDHVNARVKHRQGFRPFAPAVLAERAGEFFEGEEESPFMLLVKRVRPEALDKVAAIAHVDGTARVQTVRKDDNPAFYALIHAFGEITGVPVLLNTSFNLRGEPIVETPIDAVETFLDCELDALVMHDWILRKRITHRALFPFVKAFIAGRRSLRKETIMERLALDVLEG
jgi:carbamoyltransferase